MSEESNQMSLDRKKRVQRLKKLILLMLIISIVVPWVCCIVLFGRVLVLEQELKTGKAQLDEIKYLLEEQISWQENQGGTDSLDGDAKVSTTDVLQQDERSQPLAEEQDITGVTDEPESRKVYLTFDDGPSIYTDDILDILDQYDVKATFFVVGKEDEKSKEALQEIVERGHSLGMHSYGHKYSELYDSVESFAEDFEKQQEQLYSITGIRPLLYRFPGGSSNSVSRVDMHEFADYLDEQGVTYFDWNVSSGDGASRKLSVKELTDNCMGNIEELKTAVILMHDSAEKRTTVDALPTIIENILALENTVILPITEETEPVQHIHSEK